MPPTRTTAPFLYKYSSAECLHRLKTSLLDHTLYFPNPAQLNDKLEARPKLIPISREKALAFFARDFVQRHANHGSIEFLAQSIGQLFRTLETLTPEEISAEMEMLLHAELSTHRIYSMGRRADNERLWVKYAANHTGYCLEFENDGFPFLMAHDVDYGDKVTIDPTDDAQVDVYLLFRKTKDWEQEEEVRMVLFPRGQPAVRPFEPRRLRRVILGTGMTEDNKHTIHEWCQIRVPPLAVVEEHELREQHVGPLTHPDQ